MNTKNVAGAMAGTVIKIAIAVLIVVGVYNLSASAYDFGYRIFSESPIDEDPGYTITVSITDGKSIGDIGDILEEKGLIRDSRLFLFQEFFSSYHGDLKPGTYELSTAMTPDEMMGVMAYTEEELTEDEQALEEATEAQTTEDLEVTGDAQTEATGDDSLGAEATE